MIYSASCGEHPPVVRAMSSDFITVTAALRMGFGPECGRTVCYSVCCVPPIVEYPRVWTIWCDIARAYLGSLNVIFWSSYLFATVLIHLIGWMVTIVCNWFVLFVSNQMRN